MPEAIRSFIAVELDDELLRALGETQARLKRTLDMPSLRWVAPVGVHVTLKFLGDVSPRQLPDIEAGLAEIAPLHSPFTLPASGLGVFPSLSRPSVLWVGLEGDVAALKRLRDDVERVIAPLGFPTERRDFHPHLTLARVKDPSSTDVQRIRDVVRGAPLSQVGVLAVDTLSLMRSDLSPRGARYTRLADYALG